MGYFDPIPGRYAEHSNPAYYAPAYVNQHQQLQQLEEFKRITEIDDLRGISSKEFPKIETLAGEGTLGIDPLAAAVREIPGYPQLQQESIATLKQAIENASISQTQALEIVDNIRNSLDHQYNVLTTLAITGQSDAFYKMAGVTVETGRQRIELASIVSEVNRDNNKSNETVIIALGAAVVGGLVWLLGRGSGQGSE